MHDPLFELGYFALTDEFSVVWQPQIVSVALSTWAEVCTGPFRQPLLRGPSLTYLQEHRRRVGL